MRSKLTRFNGCSPFSFDLSAQQALRKSVKTKSPAPARPRVPGLIVHFHGGGFVAQSSKSHEVRVMSD